MKTLKNETLLIFTLAAVQFCHIVDFVVMMPLGPILMRTLNIGPAKFALLVSVYNISAGVAGVLYSLVADKYDRKLSLNFCFVGFIIGTIFCGMTENFNFLLAARVVAGAFGGILTSVTFAIVTDLIPFKRRGAALSIIMSAFSVASVIGVPLGLMIAEAFDWQSTFIFIAAFSFVVLIAGFILIPNVGEHIQKDSMKENLIRLYRLTIKSDYLKSYFLVGLNVFSIFMVIPFIAPYAIKNVGLSETDLKYVYFIGGLCTVITARIVGKLTDSWSPLKVFTILVPLSCIPIFLMTNLQQNPLTLYIMVSSSFMMLVSGRMIPLMTLVSEISDLKDRGTFMGVINSARSFATSFATLVSGFIIHEQGSKLQGYDLIGYASMILGFITLYFAFRLNKILQNRIKNA